MRVEDASLLAESWQLGLRAERKSPQTLKAYSDGVRFYIPGAPSETPSR